MADNDSTIPTRGLAVDNTTEVANAAGTTINPAQEDGHLATIDTSTAASKIDLDEIKLDTDNLDVALSTRLADATFTSRINTEGQKTMAASTPVVIASDQSAIPVTIAGSGVVELPQYNTAAAVAAGASNTHSYTPGSTVLLDGFDGAASGQAKWEFQYGTTGSETTKVVCFTPKSERVSFRFPNPISITSAMTVKLIRTNEEPVKAQDLYSTIMVH
jgi:hypothetical protein